MKLYEDNKVDIEIFKTETVLEKETGLKNSTNE